MIVFLVEKNKELFVNSLAELISVMEIEKCTVVLIPEKGIIEIDGILELAKQQAAEKLVVKTQEYQGMIEGTDDAKQLKRYERNALSARAYLSGTQSPADLQSLQSQYAMCCDTAHPVVSTLSLDGFAHWIVAQDDAATEATGIIESLRGKTRADINSAETVAIIDAVLLQSSVTASEKYNELLVSVANVITQISIDHPRSNIYRISP
jgi:hypothetical protein